MEHTINKDGNIRHARLDIKECFEVFFQKGRYDAIYIGHADTYEEAIEMKNDSEFDNNHIWIWSNQINN